ncbi:3-dehydroquinate synthase [Alkalihalobacillus trypoxylicola]|uniref:3-dehydroquinate synthase n=1 Tax=Alkalihalobacillus trypoxylicola TaxID=519424 RepID=A0A162EGZ4_9BACI|nr:3-dehydroquinate synthase [Alkalihalobacillus trypoxylicola]KYG32862.1 3-dehydroquinate synthase [Alkalihalobacillus trypoxylicola]
MQVIQVEAPSKTYQVFVKSGIIKELATYIAQLEKKPTSLFIITDSIVEKLYLDSVKQSLNHLKIYEGIIPSGEASKSFEQYERLLTIALQSQLDRHSLIVALGGGVVGDIAGFVAATYMRGIRFIQVPTTLLAQDSSVGGKVAINHPLGKNMIGAFYQPEMVLYDPTCFTTLPSEELRSGFAEVYKHGLINDELFFDWLHKEITDLTNIEPIVIEEMLKRSIEIKASIVKADEKESGIRAYLNLGHTLGHAIEKELGYGKMTHGEAVTIGILFAMNVSEELLKCSLPIQELKLWLSKLGYSTELPKILNSKQLLNTMKSDKKAENGTINMVLMREIGKVCLMPVKESTLLKHLEKMLEE